MTVSRVINHLNNVQAETRARVEHAIAELGYVPNPAARTLAGGRQCRLALIYDNPSTAFMTELLTGCLDSAPDGNAQISVARFAPGETIEALAERLRRSQVDGVLVPSPLGDEAEAITALLAAGLVLARVATSRLMASSLAIGIDDEGAAHAITSHLIALGHRRIGLIAGADRHLVSALRQQGYARALRDAGLPADPGWIAKGDYSYRSGMIAAEALLARQDRPTAIFASNDDMAAAAIAVAHRRHLDVPQDLSICGFDDSAMARTIWPELTTIRQPVAAMAARAVELLAAGIASGRPGAKPREGYVQLDFELVLRASTAPPPAIVRGPHS